MDSFGWADSGGLLVGVFMSVGAGAFSEEWFWVCFGEYVLVLEVKDGLASVLVTSALGSFGTDVDSSLDILTFLSSINKLTVSGSGRDSGFVPLSS